MKSPSAALRRHRLRQFALCSTALSVSLLAGSVAMAAAPAAGSLPGNFTIHNGAGTGAATYTLSSTSNTSATIAITTPGATATALDFGGAGTTKLAPATGTLLPSGVTQNSGFSVGSGATVKISGASTFPLLINDTTGNPSQIYGSVTNDGTGAMFVANQNGVVVGSTGSISTGAGLGLIGFAQSGSTFATSGKIAVDTTTAGTGGVTIDSGATLRVDNGTAPPPTDTVLVASNGAINVGANATAAGYNIISGYGVSGTASSGTVLNSGSSASVTLTAGSSSAPIEIASLAAAGNVSNSGVTDFTDGGAGAKGSGAVAPTIGGAFSNTGVAYVGNVFKAASITNSGQLNDAGGKLTASGLSGATSGADITNTGVINETNTGGLQLIAGTDAGPVVNGNVSNTGVIDFTTAPTTGGLSVLASNIQMLGSVEQASGTSTSAPLSASNQLHSFSLGTYPDSSGNVVGVVDYGTTIYAGNPSINAQAVRIMSGGLYDSKAGDSAAITVGTGAATDPFAKGAKLAYNLSVFPKAMIEADTVNLNGTDSSGVGDSSMNLDGVVSSQVSGGTGDAIFVTRASNVNGGASGGFALNDGGALSIGFSGNVNNPYGAAAAGSSDFRYNYLPVAVANAAAGGAGTVNLVLDGPTNSTTTAQNVNILVNGNVAVVGAGATATLPTTTTPITPASSYVNNHLVLQATGNIDSGATYEAGKGITTANGFYWPGLVYLNTVSSTSNPTQLSSGGAISLYGNLSNILPALSTGGTGMFLETNNINLATEVAGATSPTTYTVTTSNNSWVNFANAKIASAFSLTQASNFFGGYKDTVTPTVTELGLQQLPAADFQP